MLTFVLWKNCILCVDEEALKWLPVASLYITGVAADELVFRFSSRLLFALILLYCYAEIRLQRVTVTFAASFGGVSGI